MGDFHVQNCSRAISSHGSRLMVFGVGTRNLYTVFFQFSSKKNLLIAEYLLLLMQLKFSMVKR